MSGFDHATIATPDRRAEHDASTGVDEARRLVDAALPDPDARRRADEGPGAPDSPENLLHFARRRALRLVGRRAFTVDDVDDLVQEAYLDLLAAHRERGGRAPNERLVVDRVNKLASRWHLPADVRYESFAGRRAYLGLLDEFLQSAGRMPTKREEDAIAEGVRRDWHDPEHRPAPGFHRLSLTPPVSFDERWCGDEGAEPAVADHATAYDGTRGPDRVDAVSDAVADAAEAVADRVLAEGAGAVERRRRAWSLFAEALGLPDAAAASLSPRVVTAAKAVVRGRVPELAAAYLEGETDETETEALFAPFAACTLRDRDRIAAVLGRHAGDAERLWTSAVNAANRRGATR